MSHPASRPLGPQVIGHPGQSSPGFFGSVGLPRMEEDKYPPCRRPERFPRAEAKDIGKPPGWNRQKLLDKLVDTSVVSAHLVGTIALLKGAGFSLNFSNVIAHGVSDGHYNEPHNHRSRAGFYSSGLSTGSRTALVPFQLDMPNWKTPARSPGVPGGGPKIVGTALARAGGEYGKRACCGLGSALETRRSVSWGQPESTVRRGFQQNSSHPKREGSWDAGARE